MSPLVTRLGAAGAVIAACLSLAACGGSSNGATTSGQANVSPASSSTGTAGGGRFAALRTCLQKQGITLPNRPRPQGGTRAPGAGLFFGGGGGAGAAAGAARFQNNPKLRAAMQKCGFTPGQGAGARPRNSARFKQAITSFVACMKQNGVTLPAPNLSGAGPVFNRSQVNTSDPKFTAAANKCQSLLRAGRGTGAGGTPQTTTQ
jgi:hypothetical protein